MGVFLLSQAMLTARLLSCVLLLALPPALGVQMGVAPLKGIRRPDPALFSEFPGEYGQVEDVWGNDNCWAQICLPRLSPPSPIPIPTLGGGYLVHGGCGPHIFCPRFKSEWPKEDNCRPSRRSSAAEGRSFGGGNSLGKGIK